MAYWKELRSEFQNCVQTLSLTLTSSGAFEVIAQLPALPFLHRYQENSIAVLKNGLTC